MRILYLHPKSWTGEYAMLVHLRTMGHDLCVLEETRELARGSRRFASYLRDEGDGLRTLWYDPRRGWKRLLTWLPDRVFRRAFEGRNLVHRMWVVREAVRHFNPDVVVCSDGFTYAIPAAFLKRLGWLKPRLVVSYIGGDILDCPEWGVGKRRTPMVSWLIQTSLPGIDVLRALCESLERILIREGADPERIARLPIQLVSPMQVLDAIFERREQVRDSIRRQYGFATDAPLVVTLSGNHKGKGLQDLAAAWAAIVAAVPGCRWLMCGHDDEWLARGVWPVLRAAGVQDSVVFAGKLQGDAVFEHLAAADLHVNPTRCEGLNMVTVEAAAVGTPTVTSDGAGIADWVSQHEAGLVVPAGDVAALQDAVITAMNDPALRLTWQGRSRIMAGEFSLDRIASGLLELMRTPSPSHPSPSSR
jgi:glycosyltransferase involved in cell wall biosynthesis